MRREQAHLFQRASTWASSPRSRATIGACTRGSTPSSAPTSPPSSWPPAARSSPTASTTARTNRLAHLLRDQGLQRLDHYSIFMENNSRYLEMCGAGERSGLYYTCINSHLTTDELAYIVNNSDSRVFITSREKLDVAREVVALCPRDRALAGRRRPGRRGPVRGLPDGGLGLPGHADRRRAQGAAMLYSSGTTGRPEGDRAPARRRRARRGAGADAVPASGSGATGRARRTCRRRRSTTPRRRAAVGLTIRVGGTAIIMERFDPEQYLQLVEQYRVTHSQLVPTMFNRMLKLPEEVALDATTCRRSRPSSTPPRRARSRSRSR